MVIRPFKFPLMLLLTAVLATPGAARTYIECADGSPCGVATAIQAHSCCEPVPCNSHPTHSSDKRCVIKTTPALMRATPLATPDLAWLSPVAPLTIAVPDTQPIPIFTLAIPQERHPTQPPPKQGRAPRSPPSLV